MPVLFIEAPPGIRPEKKRVICRAVIVFGFATISFLSCIGQTMNAPHYMFYARNVRDPDIGGKPLSPYPFVLPQGPGLHDVIVLLVGQAEKAKILADSKDLLSDLCSYRKHLCLDSANHDH